MAKRNKTKPRKSLGTRRLSPGPIASGKKGESNIMLTTLAVGAVGVLGYLGWQYVRKRKMGRTSDLETMLSNQSTAATLPPVSLPSSISPVSTATPSYIDAGLVNTNIPSIRLRPVASRTTGSSSGSFILKKGSKGDRVKALQEALIAQYGPSILPKYGADGDLGSETVAALKKMGLPATIDESAYNVIIGGGNSSVDKNALASKLLMAAQNRNLSAVISLLKQLRNKEDYRQVSAVFSQYRLRGVRQTLVNGILSSFTSENQKQQIRFEFLRMGLRFDGGKWSLDGLDGRPIVTVEPTAIWLNATQSVQVPAMMVLGPEVNRRLDYTLFENNNKHFLVPTRSVKYL